MLSFFVAGDDIYAFLMNKDHYGSWRIKSPALVLRKTGNLLREMGNYEQNRELSLKDLVDSTWKQSAKQVLDAILDGSQADFTVRFPEMVIVPDGFLWYVPFEALQVNIQDQLRPLDLAVSHPLRADGLAGRSRGAGAEPRRPDGRGPRPALRP